MKSIATILMAVLLCGCGAPLEQSIENKFAESNTLRVQNRSGEDILKIKVIRNGRQMNFRNVDQFSNRNCTLRPDAKGNVSLDIFIHFSDETTFTTNNMLQFADKPLQEVTLKIASNRAVRVTMKDK